MRARRQEIHNQLAKTQNRQEPDAPPRPSVAAIEETEKFKGPDAEPTHVQKNEGERNFETAAAEQAAATGRPQPAVLEEIREKLRSRSGRSSSPPSRRARSIGRIVWASS